MASNPARCQSAGHALALAREAAHAWSKTPLGARLAIVRRARRLIAQEPLNLAHCVVRAPAETLVAEILPLLEALRFLERRARGLLAPRPLRGARPVWLWGVSAHVRRDPLGVVLVLAPGNYPLFLPGVQVVQALVAGNAVCLKPAPGGVEAARALNAVLDEAGLPPHVLQLLDADSGPTAVAQSFDRIVLTGSAQTGTEVLKNAARRLTPTTLELSGCDAAFVLPDADLELTADSLAYGLRLNGGATCIAPRRVYCGVHQLAELERRLVSRLDHYSAARLAPRMALRVEAFIRDAVRHGARVHRARGGIPALVIDPPRTVDLNDGDLFAPWLALIPTLDVAQAETLNAQCPYALGCSIFGPQEQAEALARRVRAGSVCINDLIVPTADPRLSFGGRGLSGFGRTRGEEGLLEMTALKTISIRRGRWRPHLHRPQESDAGRYAQLITLLHGDWWGLAWRRWRRPWR